MTRATLPPSPNDSDSDGSDGDVDNRGVDGLRNSLCDKIQADIKKFKTQELRERHESALRECLHVREEGANPTILHWIVALAEGRRVHVSKTSLPKDGEFDSETLLMVTKLSLELSPDLLKVPDNRLMDTALHRALRLAGERKSKSDYNFIQSLVEHMCNSAGDIAIRDALSVKNEKHETCIHVAVVGKVDIANRLVKIADVQTLMIRRRSDNDKVGKPEENTALHDAVAYKRCLVDECTCPSENNCDYRSYLEGQMYKSRERILELVQLLVQKAPETLSTTNWNDQSPYLYHRYTRDTETASVAQRNSRLGKDTPQPAAPAQDFTGVLQPPNPSSNTEHLRTSGKGGTAGKLTSQKAETGTERPKPYQAPASSNNIEPLPNTVSDQAKGSKQSKCPNMAKSSKIATEVESYLLESAFTIEGGFKKVCNCFYGKKRGKGYKNPNFKPGHALGSNEKECYKFLKPPSIMSQVHLIVPWTRPPPVEDWQTEEEHLRVKRGLWDDDMESLKSVFAMLAEKGVERILKLIVSDNKERPCSDEVIVDCIRRFDVRYLDWRKEDLSADVVLSAAPNLVELWLYSSGRSAVLRGWAASTALCNLSQVRTVHIDAPWVLESYKQYVENLRLLDTELKRNMAQKRNRLFLQFCKDTSKYHLPYQEKYRDELAERLQKNQNRLDKIKEDLENLKARDKHESPRAKEKSEKKAKYEYLVATTSSHIEDADKAISKLKETQTLCTDRVKELDYRMANREVEVVQSLKISGNKGSTVRAEDGGGFAPSPYPPVNPEDWPKEIEKQPKFFKFSGGGAVISDFKLDITHASPPKEDSDDSSDDGLRGGIINEAAKQHHRWLKSIDRFVTDFVTTTEDNLQSRIKVALIDDGIDANRAELMGLFSSEGWPPEEPSSEQYGFYKSGMGHGTSMALLIKKICPRVMLYIAKLGDWTDDERMKQLQEVYTAKNATDAIEWAIGQGVQIISMSWTLIKVDTAAHIKQIELLREKIQKAAGAPTIMYCAAADDSHYGSNKELYPAGAGGEYIKTVGSADEHGEASTFVDKSKCDYLFPGEDIEILEGRKGSSAATAIASGFAALILWCFEENRRVNRRSGAKQSSSQEKDITNPKMMHHVMKKLMATDSKWVDANKLFKQGNDVAAVVRYCQSLIDTHDLSG